MVRLFSSVLTFIAVALNIFSSVFASPTANIDSLFVNSPNILKNAPETTSTSPKIDPKSGCAGKCASSLHFSNPLATRYEVTNAIPSNTFRTPTSWAGEMPNGSKENNTLFFWLWGAEGKGSTKDTVIWLNGGPGCSSLIGFLQENGPISYNPTMSHPQPNPYSWTKAANMLWVEQPAGVGFSRLQKGTRPVESEADIAEQFSGFLANMKQVFHELFQPGHRLWIAAESYGGIYTPYIAQKIYKDGDKFNLAGIMLVDAEISDYGLQTYVPALEYALHFQDILKFKSFDLELLQYLSDECHYTNYTKNNLHYPSRGRLQPFNQTGCNTYDQFLQGAGRTNPNFNVYRITDRQNLTNVLEPANENGTTFFDNRSLQQAIHADPTKWAECSYPFSDDYDTSPAPDSNGVLQYVIEAAPSKRNVIVHGALDGRLLLNGTLLALQNLTWNNKRGFSKPLTIPLIDVDGKKAGTYRTERSLTAVIADKAGHMVPSPQDAPGLGLALVQYLVGTRQLS